MISLKGDFLFQISSWHVTFFGDEERKSVSPQTQNVCRGSRVVDGAVLLLLGASWVLQLFSVSVGEQKPSENPNM